MPVSNKNRFEDFFEERKYIAFKKYLYSYLLRKRAIEKIMAPEAPELVLEVGSGISPIMTGSDRIIYSDISFTACRMLRLDKKSGIYVVADSMRLPFKSGIFSHIISSEVLEHVKDDREALHEFNRVIKQVGVLIVTFPHRKLYFANDDRYIEHLRRYEITEMQDILNEYGFKSKSIIKILGPIEKLIMMAAVMMFETTLKILPQSRKEPQSGRSLRWVEIPFAYVNRLLAAIVSIDAFIMPLSLASCLLIKAEKIQ